MAKSRKASAKDEMSADPMLDESRPCFNLLDEPWIGVLDLEGVPRLVNLREALVNAHKYSALCGEMPVQDIAVLRLLLAFVYTVLSRYDIDGTEEPLDRRNALKRWCEVWNAGQLPAELFENYLAQWYERFWLFHPDRPFAQVKEAIRGSAYTAAKLNGQLSESNNKPRFFPYTFGAAKESLTYAEAARWLLYVNAFDDASAKPSQRGQNMKSPGAGWLGKIGVIAAQGDTLFETLMFNCVLSRQEGKGEWDEPRPAWELDEPRTQERAEIAIPENQPELLTLQSRRIILKRNGDKVIGYAVLGGDYFPKESAFISETMTSWRAEATKSGREEFVPRRHKEAQQMWRDFGIYFLGEHIENKKWFAPAAVVKWIGYLRHKSCLRNRVVRFNAYNMVYGDKCSSIKDNSCDYLGLNSGLLEALARENDDVLDAGDWLTRIEREVKQILLLADAISVLQRDILLAGGGDSEAKSFPEQRKRAQERFFFAIDVPFRRWLSALTPDNVVEADNICERWRQQMKQLAQRVADQLVHDGGVKALVGRVVNDKIISTPQARKWFDLNLKQIIEGNNPFEKTKKGK